MVAFASVADRAAIEAHTPWPPADFPATSWQMVQRAADQFGARRGVTFQLLSDPRARAETLTWSQVRDKVGQTANLLRSLGVSEGDTVALLLPNCTEMVLSYFAAQTAGIVCPINPLLEPEQIASILRETGAKVLVTLKSMPSSDVAQKAALALVLAPEVETVLEVDLARYLPFFKRIIAGFMRPKLDVQHQAKVVDFTRAIAAQPVDPVFEVGTHDRVASYFHTGGTTGLPKVAQQRFSGITYNAWVGAHVLFTERDVMMCPLPLFHVFGSVVVLGMATASGAELVLPTPAGYRGKGVFDNFWKLIARYRATFLITVPTAISALMQRPVDADISSLKLAISGSAALPVELYKRFEDAAGLTICEGYGMTEATCLVAVNPPNGPKKIGSVGIAVPHTKIRVIDPVTQFPCAVGEVGEICVQSPGVFPGHTYTEDARNADLFYPGADGQPLWLRTGDLGKLDADGYIFITGRSKDLIIRGGHNIDPAEIEEALAAHPEVAFVGAVGQPDPHAGELPCAYVELVRDATITPTELTAFARKHIAERAAVPRHIEVLDELPKTAVGKIFKPALRKLAIQRVLDEAFKHAGLAATVALVEEDRKRGLVTYIARGDGFDEDAFRALMGRYALVWDWAPAS
ncbi:acyl-CoA synthetase [Ketogulonicigenium vulgare]|uniref:Long-chain-fatty-acid--CoA ligase, putative n=1 Tax=Ketogulonicigenium vulgare (strain WSH-001) TaxID=759362 RepID=F9YA42_KETVW|nr:acyl-CoA synthetase [Ketogulonicigenium vulgare]AEM41453.1 Long-chain-fatty-acid--CoA ligase, putative [Ketogulonicigenium vulgare WSH-001]ALJ81587.1 AMP-binding protein [Ketogulonicigenium vulgare]